MAQATLASRLSSRWQVSLSTTQAKAAGLVALIALATGTRLWHIADKSLWLDEILSWRAAHVPPSDWVDYVGAHPPLYFGMLHLWVQVAGNSEAALRTPSAIAGAATIVLLAIVASRVGGIVLAATAAVLLLLNSTQLYFSQEARMYALMGLLSLAATVALAGYINRPSLPRLVAYAALMLCVIYTHYSSFVVIAAHGCVIAGYGVPKLWRHRDPSILGGGLFTFAFIGLAYLPWLSNFRQAERLGVPHMPAATWTLAWNTLQGALGLERAPSTWLWVLLAMPLLAFGAYGIARRWRDPLAVCLGALALVPVGQFVISVQVTPIFSLRQMSPYVPALVFVLALGFADALRLIGRLNLPWRLVAAAAAVVVGGALLAIMFKGTTATYSAPPLEDWRAAAADLKTFDGPIYVTADYMVDPFNYYYDGPTDAYSFGLWSPEALPLGQTAMVGISHTAPEPVLAALASNVSITAHGSYPGISFYEVVVRHHTTVNVSVPFDESGSGWSVNPFGYLQTNGDLSPFTCECTLDENNDGLADEALSVVIEYYDAGTTAFQLFGPSRDVVLGSQALTNTNQWLTTQIEVPAGTPVNTSFGLSGGIVLRRLQVQYTHLENADLFGSYQGATRWLLRTDGYVQSTNAYSYIGVTLPIDPQGDGTIDQGIQIDVEYQSSRTLQMFGLAPGQKWRPEPLSPVVQSQSGVWRTISFRIAKGAHLQPRVYIGKGVTLRSVRVTPTNDAQ